MVKVDQWIFHQHSVPGCLNLPLRASHWLFDATWIMIKICWLFGDLPAMSSTTSLWVDCVTCLPLTLTMTSFSRIPARSAEPPGRTVCTETGRSPDKVKPKLEFSSRFTMRVRVRSDPIGDEVLKSENLAALIWNRLILNLKTFFAPKVDDKN